MRNRSVFVALFLCISAFGCRVSRPETPIVPEQDFLPATRDLRGVDDGAVEGFKLLPGDVVAMRTISIRPLDPASLVVDPRGVVDVPLAGEIQVGGLSTSDAAKAIESGLRVYDRFARVALAVSDAAGHTATVIGAVEHPGAIALKGDVHLAEVLAIAGGSKTATANGESVDLADLDAATIVRDGQALPVSMAAALRGEARQNIRVRPGDVVFVPASVGKQITVLGEVGQPKTVAYYKGLRLTTVLADAGGLAKSADSADVRVIRGSLAHPKIFRTRLNDVLDGKTHDVALAPGDVVYVGTDWFYSATEVLNRLVPALAGAAIVAGFVP